MSAISLHLLLKDGRYDLSSLFRGKCDVTKVNDLVYRLVDKVWPKTADGKRSSSDMDILMQLINHKSFALCITAFSKR